MNSKEAAKELLNRRAARNNYAAYAKYIAPDEPPAKHHILLCNLLDEVINGCIRNLIVLMPPGSAKSTYATIRFPAYYLGRFGKKNIICASYAEKLANSFGRKVRNIVNSDKSRAVFKDLNLVEDQKAKGEWETTNGGAYLATSIGGSVTGRRGDLGIIDDPVKGRKEADSPTIKQDTWDWYINDFLSRLKPNAAQVIIQTRWSEDDLSGRILPDNWNGESGNFKGKDGKKWHVVCLQAQAESGKNDPLGRKAGEWLWPEWFNTEFWEETKFTANESDTRAWASLYQQVPSTEDGTFFKKDWFNRYDIKRQPKYLTKFGAADYAVTDNGGDFTEQGICGLDFESNLYIIDWISKQSESDVWVEDLIDLHFKHDLYIYGAEKGQIRRAIAPWIKRRQNERNKYFSIEEMPHVGDKASNARSFQALAKSGKVYIPQCDWGNELIAQLTKFPAGVFDDKVDVCGLMGRLIDKIPNAILPKSVEQGFKSWDYEGDCDEDSWKLA